MQSEESKERCDRTRERTVINPSSKRHSSTKNRSTGCARYRNALTWRKPGKTLLDTSASFRDVQPLSDRDELNCLRGGLASFGPTPVRHRCESCAGFFGRRPFFTVAWGNAPERECRQHGWPKAICTCPLATYVRKGWIHAAIPDDAVRSSDFQHEEP